MACSQETLEKFSRIAKDEIGETGVDLTEAVEKVKPLLRENYGNLRLPPDADKLLEQCLRCRKFDYPRTAAQVHSFFKFLLDLYESHGTMYFLPSLHQSYFYESYAVTVLKSRDSKGRSVIMCDYVPNKMPGESYSLDKGLAAIILVMHEINRLNSDTQRIGIVLVLNFQGYGFSHAKHYTLSRLRAIARMFKGALPARYKGFHIVNAPRLFTYTYAIIKPFLGEKIKNRVHFHSNDFTEFHKHICPSMLPKFLGGSLTYEESVDMSFTTKLVTRDDYYEDLFKHGYMKDETTEGSDGKTESL